MNAKTILQLRPYMLNRLNVFHWLLTTIDEYISFKPTWVPNKIDLVEDFPMWME